MYLFCFIYYYLFYFILYSRGVGNQTSAINTVTTLLGSATLKRIELFGIGDPSGIGEGYAYVRLPILDRVNKSNQKVKKSYYNTDADIRLLHISDAVDIIVTQGISRRLVFLQYLQYLQYIHYVHCLHCLQYHIVYIYLFVHT